MDSLNRAGDKTSPPIVTTRHAKKPSHATQSFNTRRVISRHVHFLSGST
ncbi:hypothetical protein [Mesorhizobium sp. BE184]|nr:hypothetical protein [Mesorhizobium sp. BE184]MDR7031469.1 hypothetical protein [Mesorhizobium sp. BE184]